MAAATYFSRLYVVRAHSQLAPHSSSTHPYKATTFTAAPFRSVDADSRGQRTPAHWEAMVYQDGFRTALDCVAVSVVAIPASERKAVGSRRLAHEYQTAQSQSDEPAGSAFPGVHRYSSSAAIASANPLTSPILSRYPFTPGATTSGTPLVRLLTTGHQPRPHRLK